MDDAIARQHGSPFFRLPVEIRCSVYDLVLKAEILAPSSFKDAKDIVRCERKSKAPGPRIQYPSFYHTPASSLLLTCRTTLAEVSALQQRLHKSHEIPTCKLDLIITRRYAMPTWMYAPCQSKETEYNLEVSLRLMNILRNGTLRVWRDWIGAFLASFITILNSLLHHGPQFLPPAHASASKPLRLNAITVDVSGPSSHGVDPCKLYCVPPLRGTVPDQVVSALFDLMGDLDRSGLLWGKVKEMRIYSMQMGEGMSVRTTHQNISQRELDRLAGRGHNWGPNA